MFGRHNGPILLVSFNVPSLPGSIIPHKGKERLVAEIQKQQIGSNGLGNKGLGIVRALRAEVKELVTVHGFSLYAVETKEFERSGRGHES